jgi:hypothetical protein
MSETAYFPESWPLIFVFLTFLLHFMLDPDPNPVPVPLRRKVTVPAVLVPAPQHCFQKTQRDPRNLFFYLPSLFIFFIFECCIILLLLADAGTVGHEESHLRRGGIQHETGL